MAIELESKFNHKTVEKKWIEIWANMKAFLPEFSKPDDSKDPFCIVIPPPNVTGELHVGHALDQTVQDVLTRYARKQGRPTLWLPGMDHAGIATQVRVEKNLKAEGKDRHQLGREEFIKEVWKWKAESGGKITGQQNLMGFSVDRSRERFTMDPGLSKAVVKVFVDLYNKDLIYRDTRMVNWDPVTQTVLSDLEVEFDENVEGELYSFAYKTGQGDDEIIVATTRPETMLGDTAIAVHPDDDRYKGLIGKTVKHPFVDRQIPIIADSILVDMEFGTGAVKVTPAHDPNDFEVGRRHNLEFISIFDKKAHVNKDGGKFAGLERYEARKKIKDALKDAGLERGTKKHIMSIGRSQRSGAVVEPLISTQWFVKIEPLAGPAIKAVENGEIKIVPEQWKKTYFHWMHGIRDWCISRQLWWGHQIPAWFGPDDKIFVAHNEDEAKKMAKKFYKKDIELKRDQDVLDTWFSSALWPFSTLGWPEKTADLEKFYPTSVLVTGFDIIFFWVARMIMQGLYFMNAPPFHEVYLHGLLRDEHGKKMSKTVGNVIDPLAVIEKYGADAFRFFLMSTLSEGKDSIYSEQRLKGYQNFSNKIWNSSRFVLMNLQDDFKPDMSKLDVNSLEAEDIWILSEMNTLLKEVEKGLQEYKFHIVCEQLYNFTWRFFCDWYIEFIKPRLFSKTTKESENSARQVVYFVLQNMISILHPFMPFITEEINSFLLHWGPDKKEHEQLLTSSRFLNEYKLPGGSSNKIEGFILLQEVIGAVRTIRAEMGIAPDKKISIIIKSDNANLKAVSEQKAHSIQRIGKIESIQVDADYKSQKSDAMEVFSNGSVYISLEGILDIKKETMRLKGELDKYNKMVSGITKKLSNEKFLANAPDEVVEKEKSKLTELEEKSDATKSSLTRLSSL